MENFVMTDEVFKEIQAIIESDEYIEIPQFETFEQFDEWLMNLKFD